MDHFEFAALEADYAILEKQNEERVKAKHFDFNFNQCYYNLNVDLSRDGLCLSGLGDRAHGRVVMNVPILKAEGSEDIDVDTVPLSEQPNKYYFQYRIDRLSGNRNDGHPRIVLGLSWENFMIG